MPYKLTDPWHSAMRAYRREMNHYPMTWKRYRSTLNKYGKLLGWPNPRQVALPTLRGLERSTTDRPSTKAVQLSVLRYFLVWVGNRDAARWRFSYSVVPKSDGVFLDELEVASVRAVAHAKGTLDELLYSLGVDNGLRIVDMERLTFSNAAELVRSGRSMILGKGRNGGKLDHLELNRRTREPLIRWLAERQKLAEGAENTSERLFVRRQGSKLIPLSNRAIYKRLKRLSKAAGIKFNPHDLRRTYGHRLHLAGVPIETIARLMRHSNINQAFRAYIGIKQDELREAQDRLP